MKLSNAAIQNKGKPGEKTFKLFDGEGLYLEIRPNGKRHWRLKYRIAGKEKLLMRISDAGAVETAHRVRSICGQVWRYGVVNENCERDIAADLRDALPSPDGGNHAAVTDPDRLAEILKTIDGNTFGTVPVKVALQLAPLLFVRPGELRHMHWCDVDLDGAQWLFKSSKARGERKRSVEPDHVVPLAKQAVKALRELQATTGHGRYVFPNGRTPKGNRAMSENAVLGALRRLDIGKDEMSGHGFRATARTILDEVLGIRVDLIEHQLAHAVKDPNGRAYNRTTFLPERAAMMQQ